MAMPAPPGALVFRNPPRAHATIPARAETQALPRQGLATGLNRANSVTFHHQPLAFSEYTMRNPFQKISTVLLGLLAALALSACASSTQTKTLDVALSQYEKFIRWSEWEAASGSIAPKYLAEHPITRLDMDRLKLFRVTGYMIRSTTPDSSGLEILQVVEISLFNRTQAVERTLIDQQVWRYDEDLKRWMLHSSLPDVTKAR